MARLLTSNAGGNQKPRTGAVSALSCLFVITLGALSAIFQLRVVSDHDLFEWLRLGNEVIKSGTPFINEPFVIGKVGEPIEVMGWLSHPVFSFLEQIGGFALLRVFYSLLLALTIICFLFQAELDLDKETAGQSHKLISFGLATALSLLTIASNTQIRPQGFAIFIAALIVLIFSARRTPISKILLLFPLAILWENFHPSIPVACVLFGYLFFQPNFLFGIRSWPSRLAFLIAIAVTLVSSVFLTPQGSHILVLITQNLRVCTEALTISEWMPPWHESVRGAMLGFWIAWFVTLVMILKTWQRIPLHHGVSFLLLSVASFYSARFSLFFGVALIPLWVNCAEQFVPPHLFRWRSNSRVTGGTFATSCAVSLVLVIAPNLFSANAPLDRNLPLRCISELRSRTGSARIYNYREWAGLLVFFGHPDWQVTFESRLYLFGVNELRDYDAASRGEQQFEQIVSRYHPDLFVLHAEKQSGLVRELAKSSDWKEIVNDSPCVVYSH